MRSPDREPLLDKLFSSKNDNFNSRRWKSLAWIGATVGLTTLLTLAMIRNAGAEELSILKVDVKCLDSNTVVYDPRFRMPPGIKVSIRGEFPKMQPSPLVLLRSWGAVPSEVVWLMLTDNTNGFTQRTLTWGSVDSGNVTANMDRYLNSIRPVRSPGVPRNLLGDPNYIRPFTTYEVTLGVGPFTHDQTPDTTSALAKIAFSANCISGPKAELFPDWSLPDWVKVAPQPDRMNQTDF